MFIIYIADFCIKLKFRVIALAHFVTALLGSVDVLKFKCSYFFYLSIIFSMNSLELIVFFEEHCQ